MIYRTTNDTHDPGSSFASVSNRSISKEPTEGVEGMRLRSGLRCGQNNTHYRAPSRGQNVVNKSTEGAIKREPVPDANRRITRSMTKKEPAIKTAKVSRSNNNAKSSKPRKRH